MNKINYDGEMQKLIDELKEKGEKPRLLLHSCCAPCSTACLEKLAVAFDVTVYYYNPNLDSEEEFLLRAHEQQRYCKNIGIQCIVEKYIEEEFYSAVRGLEGCLEGGARCDKCFYLRLKKTAEKAKEVGCEYFATTLTVSPLKNADKINCEGKRAESETGIKYLSTDFKKRGGYVRSTELAREFSLYRQNYCGCEFSKRER